MDVVVDFGRAEWTQVADETTFPPVKRHRLTARRSRFMETLGAVHASDGAALAALVDVAVLALVSLFLDVVPTWFRIAYPVAAVAAGYVGRLYTERDSVQTRGVGWYPGRVVGALTAVAVIPVALGVVGVASAAELEIGAFIALTGLRCLTWVALVIARRRGHSLRPTLIIGAAQPSATVWRRLVEFPEAGLLPVQLLTFDAAHEPGVVQDALDEWDIEHVVLVAPGRAEAALTASLPRQSTRAPFFSAVPALTELFLDPGSVTEVGGIPLIPLGRVTRMRHRFPGKRVFDIAVSSLLLLLGAPLFALVAIAVKLDDGGPVFYRQARVGRNGELFRMVKFRTMVVDAEQQLDALLAENVNITDGLLYKFRDDPRITRVGHFLRKRSLDELPQLWNVLRGQMSMVGPRPLAVEPHDFAAGDAERHSVVPGITGYWQLSGGPELSYGEMIRLDLSYIRNWSLWLDLRLILRTIPAMLHRHGAA